MDNNNSNYLVSYLTIRRVIGIMGMFLPFTCILFGCVFANDPLKSSISLYYYSNVRDVFVGIMFCVSVFLICYKGYAHIDNVITSSIGVCGFLIALFPCLYSEDSCLPVGLLQVSPHISNIIHSVSATVFFMLLAINSIFLFTLSKPGSRGMNKKKVMRNRIYIGSGIVILICIAILLIYSLHTGFNKVNSTIVFFMIESVMLFAFGVSWFVKGETILKDKKIHNKGIIIAENVRTGKTGTTNKIKLRN